MKSRLMAAIWRRLGFLQKPILWILCSKFTIGVGGIIVNEAGHVWLQKHRFWPGQSWGLPGGHVEYGEQAEAALQRELHEETGLLIDQISLFSFESSWSREKVAYYTAQVVGGHVNLDMHEVVEAGYFPVTELPQPLLPAHATILKQYFASKENSRER